MRIFEIIAGTWVQVGNKLCGGGAQDNFGTSVFLDEDGSHVAVAGWWSDGIPYIGTNVGGNYVYEDVNGTWTQMGSALYGQNSLDTMGSSTALSSDGMRMVTGSVGDDTGGNGG